MVQQLAEFDIENMDDDEIDALLDDIVTDPNAGGEERAAEVMIQRGLDYDNRGGFITVYDAETGMPSQVLYYMLRKTIKDWRKAGKRLVTKKPSVVYALGDLPCMLHPSHPMRAQLDALGLQANTCRKNTLRTFLDVRRHMQHKHKGEWDVIEENRQRLKDEEEAEFRRFQMDMMRRQMGELPTPELSFDEVPEPVIAPMAPAKAKPLQAQNRGELMETARDLGVLPEGVEWDDNVTRKQMIEAIKAAQAGG